MKKLCYQTLEELGYQGEDRYRKVSMQMQVCQEEISKQAKTAEELKEICQKGREYLNLHRNTNECPLCHTPFDDWETLFLRINNIQEQNEDSLKGRLGKYHAALNQISDEYESFNLQCESPKPIFSGSAVMTAVLPFTSTPNSPSRNMASRFTLVW